MVRGAGCAVQDETWNCREEGRQRTRAGSAGLRQLGTCGVQEVALQSISTSLETRAKSLASVMFNLHCAVNWEVSLLM